MFALADERRLPVLCHAGRGIPALGRHSIEACARYPGMRLILAHAGISDLSWIWREAPEHPNLFFDTAWWSPSDYQALFALVPPGQILFASDAPYGATALSATWALRHALQVGLSPGSAAQRHGWPARRGSWPVRSPPTWVRRPAPRGWEATRCSTGCTPSCSRPIGQAFAGIEPTETLALATLACDVGDDAPQADICAWIVALIEERADYQPGGPGAARALRPRPSAARAGRHAGPHAGRAGADPPLGRLQTASASSSSSGSSTKISKPIGGWKVTWLW